MADFRRRYFPDLNTYPSVTGNRAAAGTRNALVDALQGVRIRQPTFAESFIPVVGPAWEAVADYQDGDLQGAAFNGAMAVADAFGVGVGAKGLRALSKGAGLWKARSLTAEAARKAYRAKGMAKAGEEVHHTRELNGISRSAQNWRNHYPFLKPLPQAVHRRLRGKWGDLPKYGPAARFWHGTTDWMKAGPVGAGGYLADSVQNVRDSSRQANSTFNMTEHSGSPTRYPGEDE